jgi:hypothetical protein
MRQLLPVVMLTSLMWLGCAPADDTTTPHVGAPPAQDPTVWAGSVFTWLSP